MFNPENRYKEFDNSKKRGFHKIKSLINDSDELLKLFYTEVDEFNKIRAIYKTKDIDSFREDNIKNLKAAVDIVKSLTDFNNPDEPITIYRGIMLGPDDVEPDLLKPGLCWTDNEHSAETFILCDDFADDPDYAECILTGTYKASDIDWIYSIALMLDEPTEREIRLYKDAIPISIDYQVL